MAVIPLRRRAEESEPAPLVDVMRLVARGDESAFAELYDRMAPAVFGTCRRVLRDPAQAEEVAQEVLLEVWRTAPRYAAEKGSVATWMLTMAHRRAVDRVRSAQASVDRDRKVGTAQFEREYDEVSDAVLLQLERDEVTRALESLTSVQREAIELAYFQGYTHVQVAELLDIPLGTAKTRVRDGLIRLRDAMGVTS